MSKLELTVLIDTGQITKAIADAKKLDDNDTIFAGLAQVARVKAEATNLLEAVEIVERQVKDAINDKAKALYGTSWSAIKGDNYRITRSLTGPIYELDDNAAPKFTKAEIKPNGEAIEEYMAETGRLPKGVRLNEHRGESLRITVKDDSQV